MRDPADNTRVESPSPAEPWHTREVAQIAAHFDSSTANGLSQADAATKLAHFGANELREKPPRGSLRLFADQFADFMILILIAAAVVAGIVGEPKDSIAIAVIVLLNAVIGFVQSYRAQRALAALKKLAAAHAQVVRDGERRTIVASHVVPGDLVLLEAGNVVPADVRLAEAARLKVDESLLTGESATTEKRTHALTDAGLSPGDRHNMAFKGTTVTYGRGTGLAVATGMRSELGQIATLLDSGIETDTPLEQRMSAFGRRLGLAVIGICVVLLVVGLLRGEPPLLMVLTAISLAVAAIPEALPAVITISLAFGARKLAKQNALVRKLPAVETLGSVTYICSDKTGTLTQNRMRVDAIHTLGETKRSWHDERENEPFCTLLRALALSNDASAGADGGVLGDPTEVALFECALEAGVRKASLEVERPRVRELPFDADRKRMTTFHRDGAGFLAYTKGAPETVLERCVDALTQNGAQPVALEQLLAAAESMAADGLRVLAVAQRSVAELPASDVGVDTIESGLSFLGLVGLMDPPRPEVAAAVALCRTAGITPVMITGDHPATARAIAERLGIAERGSEVLTGADLAALDDGALSEHVARTRVYARVDPAQKIRIVSALKARGEFVAMTGDGVNDAPALKAADIGIAMGQSGTDVAREASSLVLLDDNFASIVGAVRVGRRIYDNIRKFIKYAMTGNSGEIWTIFLAPLVGLPIPLLPIHILWINLVTDGLPGLALTAEPEEERIMSRPPRPPTESIFAHGMWQHIVALGLTMGGVCLATQAWALHVGSANWRTMVFTVLTLSQMGHVLAVRSERVSFFSQGPTSNLPLLAAVALTFGLQLAIIYTPSLQAVFDTTALTFVELAISIAMSSIVFACAELEKVMIRWGLLYRSS